jgi:DUF2934 family protein
MIAGYPSESKIRARAYQIYLERGGHPDHDADDWLQAEYELMQLPVHKIAEMEPPRRDKRGRGTKSLIDLVHAAIVLRVEALPHLKHMDMEC